MKIESISPGQISLSGMSDILTKLNIGDRIRAQVLEITANELILKLFDGSTIAASTVSQIDAEGGDFLEFTVKAKNDKQIFLETVKNGESKKIDGNEIVKQLELLKIKPEPRVLEAAKEIKAQNFQLDKALIEKTVESLLKFKGLSVDKAVFLNANNIKVNEGQIAALERIVEGRFKIGSELSEIIRLLEFMDNAELFKRIRQQLSSQNNCPDAPEVNRPSKNLQSKLPVELVIDIVNSKLESISSNDGLKTIAETLKLSEKLQEIFKAAVSDKEVLLQKFAEALNREAETVKNMTPELKKQLDVFINNLALKIRSFAQQYGLIENDVPEYIKSDKEAVVNAFRDSFIMVESDSLKIGIGIKRVYNELSNKLEAVREALVHSSNIPNASEVLSRIDGIENSLKFLSQINSCGIYIQVPLNIQNGTATGELYILKKNLKKKKIDPENATMFISLNTLNMGQVDSLVILNKKNVSVNMRLEDRQIIDFVKQRCKALYESLAEKGYKLVDFKYRLVEEQVNILNINGVVRKQFEENKHSIDYRI